MITVALRLSCKSNQILKEPKCIELSQPHKKSTKARRQFKMKTV